LLKKTLGDPTAAVDGSIPGAISGVFAGVLIAILAGILSGEAGGETVAKVLLGFVVGFGVGTLLGATLAAVGRRFRPNFQIRPGFALVAAGAVIGSLVAAIAGASRWIALGGVLGGVGANLWPLLCRHVESAISCPPSRLNLDEDDLREDD
jgi:hypothetical protein